MLEAIHALLIDLLTEMLLAQIEQCPRVVVNELWMPLEAQHLILDVVGANRAEVAGSEQCGLFRQAGDLILVTDQQLQLVQRRAHPLGLVLQSVAVYAHTPALLGTLGLATQQHLAAELLAVRAGTRMTHVPFHGTGQAVDQMLAGRSDFAIDTLPAYLPHIREGRVRALATTAPRRIEWLPDLPTVAEQRFPGFEAPGFDAGVWYMLMGPAGLPAAVTERLAASVNRALDDSVLHPRIRDAGFIPGGGTSADAAALLRRDAERHAALIRSTGIHTG